MVAFEVLHEYCLKITKYIQFILCDLSYLVVLVDMAACFISSISALSASNLVEDFDDVKSSFLIFFLREENCKFYLQTR